MKSREIRKFRKTYRKYTYDCVSEGYKLAVLFDEKDEVKQYGGRWHPYPNDEGGYWWMPANKINDQIHDNGTLVRQWLNDNEMIMGQYGKVQGNSTTVQNLNPPDAEYELSIDDYTGYFHVWEAIGIAGWTPNTQDMTPNSDTIQYMTLDDGRAMWNDLMRGGYRRIIREKTLTSEEDTV